MKISQSMLTSVCHDGINDVWQAREATSFGYPRALFEWVKLIETLVQWMMVVVGPAAKNVFSFRMLESMSLVCVQYSETS